MIEHKLAMIIGASMAFVGGFGLYFGYNGPGYMVNVCFVLATLLITFWIFVLTTRG